MLKVYPLFSGSSGNCTYIEFSGQNGILIDAGKSAKQIERLLDVNNINSENIKAIFVTHEHSDHISGLKVFANRYNFKIYASEGTASALRHKEILVHKNPIEIITKKGIDLNFTLVRPFNISHDCAEGLGYVFEAPNGEKVATCTDLGYISKEVSDAMTGCHTIFIESNHDIGMLENGPYPYYLKRRILSEKGHLSNAACTEFLPKLVEKGTKNIILSHLSSNNNVPELAFQTAVAGLGSHGMSSDKDYRLFTAPKVNENKLMITA